MIEAVSKRAWVEWEEDEDKSLRCWSRIWSGKRLWVTCRDQGDGQSEEVLW